MLSIDIYRKSFERINVYLNRHAHILANTIDNVFGVFVSLGIKV